MARPTKYKAEFAKQAEKLAAIGLTDQEVADFFEVDVRTVHRWKADKPEFCQSLKVGKELADNRVERSLYQMAVGYEQDEVKIFMPGGKEAPVYAPFRAKIAPNVTAAIFWLKNRQPDKWREKKEEGDGDESDAQPVKVELTVVDGRKRADADEAAG